MILAIDAGNSTIAFGFFEGDELVAVFKAESRTGATPDEYAAFLHAHIGQAGIDPSNITGVVISCVVGPLVHVLFEAVKGMTTATPMLISTRLKLPVKVRYATPETLGGDRLASASAAYTSFGGPVIVVDFGTATTIDVIAEDGGYLGGAIAPGMNMIADALHLFTARLPRVDIAAPSQVIATNTNDGLRAGVFYGYLSLIEGLARRTLDEMNTPTASVIATGGLARIVAPHIPLIHAVDMELPYEGLRIIHELNKNQENHKR